MVIKFSIHVSNRYKLKVTKFQSFIYFRKEVIKKKPLGGAESAPPPSLNRVKMSLKGFNFIYFLFLVLLPLWPVEFLTGNQSGKICTKCKEKPG